MKAQKLRQLIEANPFHPFWLTLSDGRKIRVPHRNFGTLSADDKTLTIWRDNGSCDSIDFSLVTALEVEGPKPGAKP